MNYCLCTFEQLFTKKKLLILAAEPCAILLKTIPCIVICNSILIHINVHRQNTNSIIMLSNNFSSLFHILFVNLH